MYSIKKYWPDCEYPIVIISNNKDWKNEEVTVVKVGDHKGWATDTLKAVSLTNYDYFIYFQEDYFLNKKVDNAAIKSHIEHCVKNKVDYLKIQPDFPKCDQYRIDGSDYCKNPPIKKYTINTAIAIWHRSLFEKICVPGYTGWDFEYKIIKYIESNHIEFNSEVLHTSVIYQKGITTIKGNAIQRGKWTPAGVEFLKENGFSNLIKERKVQNPFYSWCYLNLPGKGIFYYPKIAFLRFLRYLNIN